VCGYAVTVTHADPSTHPRHWCLYGSHDGWSWYALDERRSVAAGGAACVAQTTPPPAPLPLPHGCPCSEVAFPRHDAEGGIAGHGAAAEAVTLVCPLPCRVAFARYRLWVHAVGGSAGGHAGRLKPGCPGLHMAGCALLATLPGAEAHPPVPPLDISAWSGGCGPQDRRLRVTSALGSLDLVAPRCHIRPGTPVHIALSWQRDADEHWMLDAVVDGKTVPLVPMHVALAERVGMAAGDAHTTHPPGAPSTPAARPMLRGGGGGGGGAVVGGLEGTVGEAQACTIALGGRGPDTRVRIADEAAEPAAALWGTVESLRVMSWPRSRCSGARDALLAVLRRTPAAVAHPWVAGHAAADLRRRARPLTSIWSLWWWEPPAKAAMPPPLHVGARALRDACSSTPILVCHDCGASVYKHDNGVAQSTAALDGGVCIASSPCEVAARGPPNRVSPDGCTLLAPAPPLERMPSAAADAAPDEGPPAVAVEGGVVVGHSYRTLRWDGIDALAYFSHARVTIPPPAWIAAAHRRGVRVLGTVIMEWRDGSEALDALLATAATRSHTVAQLVRIAQTAGFEGWLVNVETGLPAAAAQVPALVSFVADLRAAITSRVPMGDVVWYDSVSAVSGSVAWQSRLNEHGLPFFAAAASAPATDAHAGDASVATRPPRHGGIFLDYHWQRGWVDDTAAAAAAAPVRGTAWVGVDVWGRGTWGGGGWRSSTAVAAVREAQRGGRPLGVAIFAPAWTWEAAGGQASVGEWMSLERRFWCGDGDEAGAPAGSCVVQNPSGDPAAATAAAKLAGWTVHEGSGDWDVVALGEAGNEPPPVEGVRSAFVSSHRWSSASQVVPLPAAPRPVGCGLRVGEWYCGTGPNHGDTYRLEAALLDGAGVELGAEWTWSSGTVTTSATWGHVQHVWPCLPAHAAAVRLTHGGQDAEGWAGCFGARMAGAQVSVTPPPASVSALSTAIPGGVLGAAGVRVTPHLLPFRTRWNTGAGGGWWWDGVVQHARPWVDVSAAEELPGLQDADAVWRPVVTTTPSSDGTPIGSTASSGSATPAPGTVQVEWRRAWRGGSCLQLVFPTVPTNATAVWRCQPFCLLATGSLAGACALSVRLTWRCNAPAAGGSVTLRPCLSPADGDDAAIVCWGDVHGGAPADVDAGVAKGMGAHSHDWRIERWLLRLPPAVTECTWLGWQATVVCEGGGTAAAGGAVTRLWFGELVVEKEAAVAA
jgi:hypothetical protein